MRLAKDHIDVGIFTNNGTSMLRFWQEDAGLPFETTLAVGGGVRQQRHEMNGSVFKLNEARDPLLDEPPSGYQELIIARAGLKSPQSLTDPDGNRVTLVPNGYDGVKAIGMRLLVRDESAFNDFYGRVLALEPAGPNRYRWGDTLLTFAEEAGRGRAGEMRANGYRYLTVQVWDCDAEHARALELGATEGRAPTTLGSTARISFIRDPDGNWIEISQRASLTGVLPN